MKNRLYTYRWLALVGCASTLLGQSDEPVELEGFISDEVPVEESILPTTRPFNSVYGTDRSILDTPRNVTIISREQLDAISIRSPRDFALLTSSSYTKSNFGAPATPNLRGQEADMFVNGIRKGLTSNGNGLPVNFNAVESVNIVKGPAGSVYGSSNYLGGYADLITKRAYFDAARGYVQATAGSYDTYYGTVDYSMPISDELAVRFSYSGEDTDGYYRFGKKNTQAFYATFTYRPSDNYELFVAGEYFVADYTENWGINRPTQDLIDKGLYYPNAQTDAEYEAYVSLLGNGDGYWMGEPGVNFASIFGGGGFAVISPIDLANPVHIDRSIRLLAPGDDSYGRNLWAQAIQTYTINDDMRIENNSYFQWIDRNTFSSYNYSELLRDNWSIDNRLQLIIEKEKWDLNIGGRYRFQDVWSVNHFWNEPANFWDLTRDPDLIRVPDQAFTGYFTVPDQEPRGILNNWYYGSEIAEPATDGADSGADTTSYLWGAFAQLTVRPTDYLIIDASYGLDYIWGEESTPVPNAPWFYNEDDVTLNNYTLSLTGKVTEDISLYTTYSYSQTIPVDTGGRVMPNDLHSDADSELFEIGSKLSLLDNKLFIGTAYFDREFTTPNPIGPDSIVWVDGFEIEFNYQPNKNLYATFGYSYIVAERTGSTATAYTADMVGQTNGYLISATFAAPPDGTRMEYPGSPDHQMTALVSYKWDNGFGIQANAWVTGPMNNGYEGFTTAVPSVTDAFDDPYIITVNTVEIPWQYEVNLSAIYEIGDWFFKLTAFNVTDEENWDAPNSLYGNGSVVAREPIRFELTAKYSF
jgi:hypothetical protein